MEGESFEDRNAGKTPQDLAVTRQHQESEKHAAGGAQGRVRMNVFRMLIPHYMVGGIIGPQGTSIKKMSEESRARIKIIHHPRTTLETAVIVSAKDEPDASIPPAIDGLLKILRHILGLDSDFAHATSGAGGTVITRLLVENSQAGSLIGTEGSTMKSITDDSKCTIQVLPVEYRTVFSLKDDRVVEISGKPTDVLIAVQLIASNLRKFLVKYITVGRIERKMKAKKKKLTPQSWGHLHGFPLNVDGGAHVGSNPQYMHPQPRIDAYNAPPGADQLSFYNQHQGPPVYGWQASMGSHLSNVQAIQSVATQMQMPNLEANQNMLTPQPWGHLHGGAHVGSNPQYMHPQPRIDVYYAPPGADQLSFYNQHQGPLVYGRQASMGSHLSNVQAIQSVATQMQMPNLEVNQNMLTPQPWGHLHGGAHVGYNPQYMHPQPRIDVYYAPQVSFYNQHQGPPVYGRQASMGSHLSNVQAIQSVASGDTEL